MVEWGCSGNSITATGRHGAVTVTAERWTPGPPVRRLPYPIDAALAGRTSALQFPPGTATLTESGDVTAAPVSSGSLDRGTHLLAVDASVETLARFTGPATVDASGDAVSLEFDDHTPVSIGFREEPPDPETLTVARSPAGLAHAVTVASGAMARLGPERSRPSSRGHPPLVAFDDGVDSAPPTATDRSLVFRVPDDLQYVLVAAPFAYYLGARLVAEPREAPLLTARDVGFERAYGALPSFASEVAADCRQAFYLDCLVRESGDGPPVDREPLASLGLEPANVRSASSGVRYATFLDAPVDATALPEWHLSAYVDPTYEHARSLPYLLDRLSLVYPAEASELAPRDLLERSLDDFFRGEVVSVSPVSPDLGAGAAHAWLAPGEPIDAFKTTTTAHENRLAVGRDHESVAVEVVVNDAEMADELAVADAYRESALPLSVTVRESLRTDDLARVLERDTDFVHYVGHCEVDGLACPDGHLSATSLARSGATTFFLNACGSYHEGETLVEKGSVAGGVTLDKVLNEQATRVGTAFGRLLVHGFGIDRALSLARRRIMMGQDYAVVGDGTFALAPTCGRPVVAEVDQVGERFVAEYRVSSTRAAGASYTDPVTGDTRLYGAGERVAVDREQLVSLLERRLVPVVFEGDLHWSDRLAAQLREGVSSRSNRDLSSSETQDEFK